MNTYAHRPAWASQRNQERVWGKCFKALVTVQKTHELWPYAHYAFIKNSKFREFFFDMLLTMLHFMDSFYFCIKFLSLSKCLKSKCFIYSFLKSDFDVEFYKSNFFNTFFYQNVICENDYLRNSGRWLVEGPLTGINK